MQPETSSLSNDFAAALAASDGRGGASLSKVALAPTAENIGVGVGTGGGLPRDVPAIDAKGEEAKAPDGVVEQPRVLSTLGLHIRNVFEDNKSHRRQSGIEDRLERMERMARREYSSNEKAQLALTKSPDVYLGIADTKHRALGAMISEIFANPGDKPWTFEPTPIAEVPQGVRNRAMQAVMLDMLQIQRLALQVHMMNVQAGQASPDSMPEGMPTAEDIDEILPLKIDEERNIEQEKAQQACERMEKKVHDLMIEGGFLEAFADAVEHLTLYGVCVLRGPEPRRVRRNVGKEGRGGVRIIANEEATVLSFSAVSPMDCYPSPGSRDTADGDLVIRVRYKPHELKLLARENRKVEPWEKGWNAGAVEEILAAWPHGGLRDARDADTAMDRDHAADDSSGYSDTNGTTIDGLEWFGSARGSELLGIGVRKTTAGKPVEESEYYDVDVVTIEDVVVFCRILEPELGRPLFKAVFYNPVDSWWGEGPMQKMEGCQRIANAAVRAMLVNMGMSSGPQAVANIDRIDSMTGFDLTPGKVWRVHSPAYGSGSEGSPVSLLQVPSVLGDLLEIYRFAKAEADDLTGIPAYTYGQASNAMLRSASAFSMATEAATRGVKYGILNIDRMIRSLVMLCHDWLMLHDSDATLKIGDVRCNPSGVMGLILVEQNYNRLVQFLAQVGNQFDMQIVTMEGRAYILREIAKMLHLNPDKLVATTEKLQEKQRLSDLAQELAVRQQHANAEATEAGNAPGQGGETPEVAEEPGESGNPEINAERAEAARTRRAAANPSAPPPAPASAGAVAGEAPGITPQARSKIHKTITNPQATAAAGARAAATRAAMRGGA